MSKLSKNNQGVTLIEAAIAIAVLIIGLLSVMQFFPFSVKIVGDAQNASLATDLAISKIEDLRSNLYENLPVGTIEAKHRLSADSNSYLYAFQRQTVISYIDGDLNPSGTDQGLKRINTTIYWLSPISLEEKSIGMSTIISRY